MEDTAGHSLSLPCLEWEVPREFLLHRSELILPPVLGFERFEENKYTSIKRRRIIVQCKEEDVEENGYTLTDTLTCNSMTQPVQGLGWVKILLVALPNILKNELFNIITNTHTYTYTQISYILTEFSI